MELLLGKAVGLVALLANRGLSLARLSLSLYLYFISGRPKLYTLNTYLLI